MLSQAGAETCAIQPSAYLHGACTTVLPSSACRRYTAGSFTYLTRLNRRNKEIPVSLFRRRASDARLVRALNASGMVPARQTN